jgi:hypothetical protein
MKALQTLLFAALIFATLAPLASASATCIAGGGFESILNVSDQTATGATNGTTFGDVCINLAGQTATITFTAANNYQFLDSSITGVQVNASSFSEAFVSEAPGTNTGPSGDFPKVDLNQNVNGYGTFNLTWDNFDGAANAENTFVFTVTNTSGTPWASAADVITPNLQGFDAEAHVICLAGSGCEAAGTGGVPLTFFVAEGEGTIVPEPRFYGLLLVGLMGLIGVMLRRRRAQLEN